MSKDTSVVSANSSGVEGRKVYVDAIEHALERSGTAKASERPRRSRRQIVDQLKRRFWHCEQLQRLQHRQIRELREAKTPPSPEFTHAFASMTTTMTNLAEQIRRHVDSERKAFAGLGDDELDEVLRANLPRLAVGMCEQDKRAMLASWFAPDVVAVLMQSSSVDVGGVP